MRFGRPERLSFLAAAGIALLAADFPVFAQTPAADTVPVAAHWNVGAVQDLIAVVEDSRREGLHPADYDLAGLKRAVADAK